MDAQKFLAEFGHIANAPGGVVRLRDLVLQLALQGRLVAANELDTSPLALLGKVVAIKSRLVAEKKLPREKSFPEVLQKEIAIKSPKHWAWTRFGEIWQLLSGRDLEPSQYNDKRIGIPYITGASNIENGIINVNRWTQEPVVISSNDDLIITCKGTIGKTAFNNIGDIHIARQIMAIRDFSKELNTGFLKIWLDGFVGQLVAKSKSMIPGFARDDLILAVYPLPPVEEQSRIVTKVGELMALCDKLEAQQQERRKLQNNLRLSTLQAVASATSPHELQTGWQKLQAILGRVCNHPQDVDDVIAELKNVAVRGLLAASSTEAVNLGQVKMDCSDHRSRYIDSGLMRRQKLVNMTEDETSYPHNWAVTAFDEVAIVIGGVTKGRNLRGKQTVMCPYLAVANVQRGYFKLQELKAIEITIEELSKYQVHEGDLLITEGGDWDKVGRTAIWRGEIPNCLHQNHVFKARVPSALLMNEWVELVFNSGIGRDYFAGASKQTTNLASINMTQLRSFPLPIPPLEEQQRILATLAELTAHCEGWRSLLTKKQALSALLASSVVSSFTGIANAQEEEPMKAPQTELIAPVRLATAPDIKAQAPLTTILARHHGEMSAKDLWQRFGGEIDAFYAQLKTEVAHGWIHPPAPAEMREKQAEALES
jgi:type I restriction enzyme S subunit